MSDYQAEFRNLAIRFKEVRRQSELNNLLAQAGRILLLANEEGHFPELSGYCQLQKANLPKLSKPVEREFYLRSIWTSFTVFLSLLDDSAPTNPLGFTWKQPEPGITVGTGSDLLSMARNSAEICEGLSNRLSDPWVKLKTIDAAKLFPPCVPRTILNWADSKPELVRKAKKGWVYLNTEHSEYKAAIARKKP
jgi:hypothetical protein